MKVNVVEPVGIEGFEQVAADGGAFEATEALLLPDVAEDVFRRCR